VVSGFPNVKYLDKLLPSFVAYSIMKISKIAKDLKFRTLSKMDIF
jgi:hypothetical protein